MTNQGLQKKITSLEAQIALLPKGSVGQKTINGKEYFYQRWTENKKRKEKYVPADEVEALRNLIEKRKALEKELKELRRQAPAISAPKPAAHSFLTNVRTGSTLRSFAALVKGLRSAIAPGTCANTSMGLSRTRSSFSTVCAGRER